MSSDPRTSNTNLIFQSLLVILFILTPVLAFSISPYLQFIPSYVFLLFMFLSRSLDIITALKIHRHPMWKLVKPKAFDEVLQKVGYLRSQSIILVILLLPYFFFRTPAQINFYLTLSFLFLAIALNNVYTYYSLNKLRERYEESVPLPPFYGWVFQALWSQSERKQSRHSSDFFTK